MWKTVTVLVVVISIALTVGCGGGKRAQEPKEEVESVAPATGAEEVELVAPAVGILEKDDSLHAAIQQLNDATSRGDLEALKELVTEDCQFIFSGRKQSYWDVNTKEVLEAAKEAQTTSTVEELKILERTDNKVTVRVVASSKGKTGSGRATSRNVYKKYDGKWKLAEMEVEDVSFSMAPSESSGSIEDKIPTEAFAQHIRLYRETQFTEMKPRWGMGSGPLFGVDEQVLSCVQGTTPDSVDEVLEFYRNEMKGNWQDFRESTGFRGVGDRRKEYTTLAGEKIQTDGKKVGINIRLEKEAEGTRIIIIMAPLRQEEVAAPSPAP
jgi:hypothetical protein